MSGTRLNTHWVEQLQQSRREEPAQVAAALEAQGGGVLRGVAIIEGSLAAADLPGSLGTQSWKLFVPNMIRFFEFCN